MCAFGVAGIVLLPQSSAAVSRRGVFLFGTGYRPAPAKSRGGKFRRGSLPRPIERPPAQIFAQAGVFSIKSQFKRMVASHIILHAARLCRIPPQKSHTRSRFLSSAHVRFCLRGAFSPRSRMPAHPHARFRVISLPHKFVFIRARSSHMLSYIFARAMTMINTKKEKNLRRTPLPAFAAQGGRVP